MAATTDSTFSSTLTEPALFPALPRNLLTETCDALDQLDRLWTLLEASEEPSAPIDYALPESFKLSVVIPVFNEAATILQVLRRVRSLGMPLEIIVVDDCSTDGTREVLRSLARDSDLRLILMDHNEGKGAALRTGFQAATGSVVVIQDADEEYDPRDLPAVIRPIVQGEADVVYGSRFLGDEPQDRSWLHRLINRVLTQSSNLLTGLRLTDMETCYKAFRRDVLLDLPLQQNRFGFEPEVTAKLARRGHSILEVPIRYRPRSYAEGKKIGWRDAFNALYCILRYGMRD